MATDLFLRAAQKLAIEEGNVSFLLLGGRAQVIVGVVA